MKAKQRYTLVSIAFSCITCAGTTLALVSLDEPAERSAEEWRLGVEMRPSLASVDESLSEAERSRGAAHELTASHERFAFVPHDVRPFDVPDDGGDQALAGSSWSVEITEQATASSGEPPRFTTRVVPARRAAVNRYSLQERLAQISPAATQRIAAKFEGAKVAWPPVEVAFVAIKDERALEVHSRANDGTWKFVHRYKILAASGASGPKILRGDKQVPEGIYGISYLNPNSAYHVSLRVNYPNAFDREMAAKEGRKDLGGDIMIHGKNLSAGCLAVGDQSAEELFVLAAAVGIGHVKVVIAPTDFRRNTTISSPAGPAWVPKLYTEIASVMSDFKAPAPPSLLSLLGF